MNKKIKIKDVNKTTEKQQRKKLGGITGMGFMPGQSGNLAGRPKGSVSIMTEIKKDLKEGKMDVVKRKLWELVEKGNWAAIQEIIRQIDGAPKQKMEMEHSGELPFRIIEIVRDAKGTTTTGKENN